MGSALPDPEAEDDGEETERTADRVINALAEDGAENNEGDHEDIPHPATSVAATTARNEALKDRYRPLFRGGVVGPRWAETPNAAGGGSVAVSSGNGTLDTAEMAEVMRQQEEQQLLRPNLDIPLNGGTSYITLSQ